MFFEKMPSVLANEDGPVFREPWEAHAFSLAVILFESGFFSWREWSETLAAVILEARQLGDPDMGDNYYAHWVQALERMIAAKNILSEEEFRDRKENWTQAYLKTPHGNPVELKG